MIGAAEGSRLFASRPADTNDTTVFTATINTELTRLLICNNTGGAVTFRFYHVPEGGAAGLDNALWYDKSIAANDTFSFAGDTNNGGIHMEEGDFLVVRSSSGNALGFHGYGVGANIAPKDTGLAA